MTNISSDRTRQPPPPPPPPPPPRLDPAKAKGTPAVDQAGLDKVGDAATQAKGGLAVDKTADVARVDADAKTVAETRARFAQTGVDAQARVQAHMAQMPGEVSPASPAAAPRRGIGAEPAAAAQGPEAPTGVSEPADPATVKQLQQGFTDQTQKLATENPEAFNAIAKQAFGDKGDELGALAQRGDLPQPANVRFVDRATLQGSDGAYSPDNGGTVYLTKDLKDQPEKLQQVYNEEAAHHLDRTLGGPDSKGDEGEIFAEGLKQGAPLSGEQLEAARAQNDKTTINVDGKEVEVENRWSALDVFNLATSAASWIPGAGDAVALASAAVNAAAGNYAGALMDVISLVPGVGDAIGTAGKLLIQNRLGREAAGELLKGLERYGPELKSGIQNALNAAKRKGLLSAKQHRDLSTSLQKQLDDVTAQARKAAGNPKPAINDGVVRSPDVVATLQRPSSQVTVSPYNGKHAPRKGMSDRDVAASTRSGPAKFYNGVDMDKLQRQAWDQGTPVSNGKPWKVYDAGTTVGAKNGQPTRYMRIESTPDGTIHGHPITASEFQALGGR